MASAALLERAQTVSLTDKERGIQLYSEIVRSPEPQLSDEETVRIKEQGIIQLAELFKNDKKSRELADLIYASMPFLSKISKAKASKLMRQLLDVFLDMQAESEVKVQLCQECIEWAKREKRTFLRQSLELRLVSLYFEHKLFTSALTLGSTLLKELKKLDDKNLLVELQLLESKTYHALGNLPRSRAALTAARTTANAIYTPPRLQAALDMQSGVLHAADERDFKTAYSYFYEAFEGYDGVEDARAPLALKYMLLSKVMLNAADDVNGIVSGKLALKYAGRGIDALKQVAAASHKRSLADFQQTLKEFSDELEGDEIIKAHLNTLYDTMLEQNLCRIIEPYSRVQVSYISETIRLDEHQVERKLSQMILDGLLSGVLEQRSGVLVLFDPLAKDELYSTALLTIASLTRVVDTLFQRAKKLT